MRISFFGGLAVSAALLGAAPAFYAQVITANIHGTVTDSSGAVVPGAHITVLNTSNGIHVDAKTDSKGYYVVPNLQIGGPYTVTIDASGFSSFKSTGLKLNVNDNADVDAHLGVGGASQTVEVAANAVQVETSETQLKTDVGAKEIEQLPLLGRDASQLQKTAPGVVEASDRFGNFSTNGSQTTQNSYLLDGADINDSSLQNLGLVINPDALYEEAIVSSTLNPEYSRNSGAIVNQTLKTGSNQFHGNAFEYYRDTFMNNGNYFSSIRPQFHQNLYGGTIGGPVLKNKLFFFLAYQGLRNRTGTTQQTPVFSQAQLQGDFSADKNLGTQGPNGQTTIGPDGNVVGGLSYKHVLPFAIGGCAAGTTWSDCFPSGQIPTGAFNPLALKLLNQFVPAANNIQTSNNVTSYLYNFNTTDSGASDQGIIRIDFHPTQKDTLWASSIFQSAPDQDTLAFGGASLPGFASVDAEHIKIFNADWTRIITPTTTNELRAGYYRFNFAAVNPAQIVTPGSYGFAITPQSSQAGLPLISLSSYFSLGFSNEGPQPRKDSNLLGSDIFTKIIGSHSLKFGVTFEQFGVDNPYYSDNNGVYSFNGSGTYSSGDPAIDFLLGIPDQYQQTSGSLIDAISHEYYAFAQDSWKATPNLTLNYGLSWDAETPWANHQFNGEGITCWQNSNATSGIYPGGAPGLLYPGDPGCSTYGAATVKWNHFGPRFGFDYSPSSGPSFLVGDSGAHTLAIRGGFGMYYNRDQEEEALQNLSSPPYLRNSFGAGDFGGSPAFANPFTDIAGNGSEASPFPYTVPGRGSQLDWSQYVENDMSNVDAKYNVPYSYNFNLNIQKQLPGNMVAQIGYVGSIGRRLPRVNEADPITAAGHAQCLADTAGCATDGANIHLDYPQYTAQPAIYPGSISATAPNGIPWYVSVGNQVTDGASSYHSLQASLEKQTSHGLYFTLAYTYSHALDNFSGYESASGSNGRSINFVPGFEALNYGSSDYDARHRFVALYVYQIPLLRSMRDNKLINEAIGGWQISGITALQSGFPVLVSQGGVFRSLYCDQYSYYGCPDNPNTTNFHPKSLNPRAAGHAWFDTSSFSTEPLGIFGNTGRNYFHGPGFNYTNLQLYKNFPIGGADSPRILQIRLESANVFNHPNFAAPDGNFSDSTFGQITSVVQPTNFGGQSTDPQPGRATQLSARFTF